VQEIYEGSVVIPAYNEQGVIGRCLHALTNPVGESSVVSPLEIAVVCNGCTDKTAMIAHQFPGVTVIEIAECSKISALNAGDEAVVTFPRIYLDADSELSNESARSLLREAARHRDPIIVSAAVTLDVYPCSRLARSYIRCANRTSFAEFSVFGRGVYTLNGPGRARFSRFPELVNDDYFVASLFASGEQVINRDAKVVVRPPRDVRSLVRVRSRVYYGNREALLNRSGTRPPDSGWRNVAHAIRRARSLSELGDLVVYIGVSLLAKLAAFRMAHGSSSAIWQRDDSSRI
jgi:glycosyltransferase involved in cell wall biosynthesis